MKRWHLLALAFLAVGCCQMRFAAPGSPEAMINRVEESIVHITGDRQAMHFGVPYTVHWSCSGIVIALNRVLTAAHCKGDKVVMDGEAGRLEASSAPSDLALWDVATRKPPIPVRITPVRRFEPVYGIGYAFGYSRLSALMGTVFLLNALPPGMEEADNPPSDVGFWVQGGFIHGMSGGAIVDSKGRLVGVVQWNNDGIGFSVSMLTIRQFLEGTSVDLEGE